MRSVLPLAILTLSACNPQNARMLVGDYTVWLASENSVTLFRDVVDWEQYPDADAFTIDCRDFEEGGDELRFGGSERRRICADDSPRDGNPNDPSDGFGNWPPRHETWLQDDGFQVGRESLDTWRGEAVITSEGGFQLSFHHRPIGGADLRWDVVIDPDFQPQRCVEYDDDEDGMADGVRFEDVDGDWIEGWTRDQNDLEGGSLYFLNARSSQFDPRNTERSWTLPQEWSAGYAYAKFAEDVMVSRPTRYALPEQYIRVGDLLIPQLEPAVPQSALFYCQLLASEDGTTIPDVRDDVCAQGAALSLRVQGQPPAVTGSEIRSAVQSVSARVGGELELAGVLPTTSPEQLPLAAPRVHSNFWRTPDVEFEGLDGWQELNYSWIWFDESTQFEAGGTAKGRYMMLFDGQASTSRMVIRGSFEVDHWNNDIWTTDNLPLALAERNDLEVCGTRVVDGERVPAESVDSSDE